MQHIKKPPLQMGHESKNSLRNAVQAQRISGPYDITACYGLIISSTATQHANAANHAQSPSLSGGCAAYCPPVLPDLAKEAKQQGLCAYVCVCVCVCRESSISFVCCSWSTWTLFKTHFVGFVPVLGPVKQTEESQLCDFWNVSMVCGVGGGEEAASKLTKATQWSVYVKS